MDETVTTMEIYVALERALEALEEIPAFPALTWLTAWAILKDNLEALSLEYFRNPEYDTDEAVFERFWQDAPDMRISLEYGVEVMEHHIRSWLLESGIITELEL